ncbi:hypothetical protein NDN08_004160 [Rhodosorus marinus]|uniref:Uncharacterized protein n=1 Tax=Rhodosorus marinus TaxID=101924 RepID=A0AAV8ULH3_9RHOD|nr:hypothetical protein NDN08_004160 [Rhodosorus marinus]
MKRSRVSDAAVDEQDSEEGSEKGDSEIPRKLFDKRQYRRWRRPIEHDPGTTRGVDLFITRRNGHAELVSRVEALLRARERKKKACVVVLHAAGAAIQRCADVALEVQKRAQQRGKEAYLNPQTSTTIAIDEFEPLEPNLQWMTTKRLISVLKVEISISKPPK